MPYVRNDHHLDNISLLVLECDDFQSPMCAVENEMETSKFGHRSAQEKFVHASRVGLVGDYFQRPYR